MSLMLQEFYLKVWLCVTGLVSGTVCENRQNDSGIQSKYWEKRRCAFRDMLNIRNFHEKKCLSHLNM